MKITENQLRQLIRENLAGMAMINKAAQNQKKHLNDPPGPSLSSIFGLDKKKKKDNNPVKQPEKVEFEADERKAKIKELVDLMNKGQLNFKWGWGDKHTPFKPEMFAKYDDWNIDTYLDRVKNPKGMQKIMRALGGKTIKN